jgi:hypothetical protein
MNTTWVIARTTVGDALRKRVLLVFLLIAVVMLFLALALAYFSQREQLVTFKALAFWIVLTFGALIAITTSIFLIPSEVEKRTIYSVLSKPVYRWEFFLGKFLGGAITVAVMIFLMALVLAVVIVMISARPPTAATDMLTAQSQHVDIRDWMQRAGRELALVARGTSVIYFELLLLTAISTTLSLFLTPTVNFSVTMLLFIVGLFQDVLAAWTRRGEFPITKALASAFYYITPHFQDFNIMGNIVHPEVPLKVSPALYAVEVSAYGIIYSLVLLLVGVLFFDTKEV